MLVILQFSCATRQGQISWQVLSFMLKTIFEDGYCTLLSGAWFQYLNKQKVPRGSKPLRDMIWLNVYCLVVYSFDMPIRKVVKIRSDWKLWGSRVVLCTCRWGFFLDAHFSSSVCSAEKKHGNIPGKDKTIFFLAMRDLEPCLIQISAQHFFPIHTLQPLGWPWHFCRTYLLLPQPMDGNCKLHFFRQGGMPHQKAHLRYSNDIWLWFISRCDKNV